MRLRSLLVSVLMLVAALFTVNAKATNYRYEYADVIREAEKPYTVHLTNEQELYDFCIAYANDFEFEYKPQYYSLKSYIKVPVSEFNDRFYINIFKSYIMKWFDIDGFNVLRRFQAQAYQTTDRLVNRFGEDENYMYIPLSKPIGDTLKVSVEKIPYYEDGNKYVFKNVGESVQSKLTISPVNNSINLRYFTFLRATYNLSDNNCTIVAE